MRSSRQNRSTFCHGLPSNSCRLVLAGLSRAPDYLPTFPLHPATNARSGSDSGLAMLSQRFQKIRLAGTGITPFSINTNIYSNYAFNSFSPERGFPQAVEGSAPRTFGGSLVANNPFAREKSAPVRTGQTSRILSHRRVILVLQDQIEEILLINVLRAIWLRTGNVDLTGLLAYSQRDQGISKKIPLARTFQKSGGSVVYSTVPYRTTQFAG